MKISKELLKGSTSLLVLSAINSSDMYGYEIVKKIKMASDDVFNLNEGTLYPILHAMEKEHQVESYWKEVDGRKRKYYHITKKGKKLLQEKTDEWKVYSNSVEKVMCLGATPLTV